FKMIRYYGFLSNRRRGEMLPKVYAALEMTLPLEAPLLPCYASMLKQHAKIDPYECLFCKGRMEFARFRAGESRVERIRQHITAGKLRAA
ncbi:IS91 family transposase, partial [Vibrio mediterranei]|nr:IS91 family transposase [Vibrio mediterranei]